MHKFYSDVKKTGRYSRFFYAPFSFSKQRQLDKESGSRIDHATTLNRTAMMINHGFDHRQTQAHAVDALGRRETPILAEQVRQFIGAMPLP